MYDQTARDQLENPQTESKGGVVQPLSTDRYIAVMPIVVDLNDTDRNMLTGNDVQTTAHLPGPTVGTGVYTCSDTIEVTTTKECVNKRLQLAVAGALGEARSNHVGEQVYTGSGDRLGRVGHVAFNGEPLLKVSPDCTSEAVELLATGRRVEAIESERRGEIHFRVIAALSKRCTRTKNQQA